MNKATRQFQIFAKPIGAICNLECEYCYYLEKRNLYPDVSAFRMQEEVLEAYIRGHIEASTGPAVHFTWHGGEPTLLGVDYFRKIAELQKKYKPPNSSISNNMQSNGILIDEQWCRFLSEEGFSIGLSLDGPKDLHDAYRRAGDGKPTHKKVIHAYDLLTTHRVPVDILCVVHRQNVIEPALVYRFFKEIKARYIGFIPLVETGAEGERCGHGVSAEAWGEFLCAIWDEWVSRDIGKIQVQIFEEVARTALGHPHALCIFRDTCGDVPAVEHNGDFYSCDHFVDPANRIGNITESPLAGLLEDPAQRAFGRAKSEKLPRFCRECEVLDMCHGGCPKDRIIAAPDGEPGLNYLCAGYRRFFNHSRSFADQLAIQARGPRTRPAASAAAPRPKIGRNDPCPCGSGKKYKNCCL